MRPTSSRNLFSRLTRSTRKKGKGRGPPASSRLPARSVRNRTQSRINCKWSSVN